MNTDMKERVINLLKTYRDRELRIDLLNYKMQHDTGVLSEEMIEAMALGHSDSLSGSGKGRISNKTMYIAVAGHAKRYFSLSRKTGVKPLRP